MDIRRMMGIAALGAAVTTMVTVPAGAQEPGPSATAEATSSGRAVHLSVFGQGLTVGETSSRVTPGAAEASGMGVASPLFDGGASAASVQGDGQDGSTEPECAQAVDQIPGLSLEFACSSSVAAVQGGNSSAATTANAGRIVINPIAPILETPLSTVVEPVQGGLQQLVGALEPVLGPIDDASGLGLQDTLGELFDALLDGGDLATISLGDASTDSLIQDGMASTSCVSEGTRIDVLDVPPTGELDPPPVISLILGEARTEVTVQDGTPTPVANPAGITVKVPPLGLDQPLALGQTLEIPLPEPLGTSVISVTGGASGIDEQGRGFATADGLSIDLLNGEALMGGIELSIARCSSTAGAPAAQLPQTPAAPAAPAPQLPTTGSDGPSPLALAATVGLAGLGLTLLRRARGTA